MKEPHFFADGRIRLRVSTCPKSLSSSIRADQLNRWIMLNTLVRMKIKSSAMTNIQKQKLSTQQGNYSTHPS